jgi:hypothetical protein
MVPDHEAEKYTVQAESTGHPFATVKLEILQSIICDSMNLGAMEGESDYLYPFTGQGEMVFLKAKPCIY